MERGPNVGPVCDRPATNRLQQGTGHADRMRLTFILFKDKYSELRRGGSSFFVPKGKGKRREVPAPEQVPGRLLPAGLSIDSQWETMREMRHRPAMRSNTVRCAFSQHCPLQELNLWRLKSV